MPTVTSAYTVKTSSIPKVMEAIRRAAVPARFSQDFLSGLGFTSSNDRALISVFKGLGFVDANGVPTSVYREFMDPANSKRVLARQIRAAYPALFELNTQAQTLSIEELKGKFASITGLGDRVVREMAATFTALSREADFAAPIPATLIAEAAAAAEAEMGDQLVESPALTPGRSIKPSGFSFSHTLYINLPATRDVAVYDAIFKALKEHLL